MMLKLRALCAAVMLALALIGTRETAFAQAVQVPPAKVCFQATTGISGLIGTLGNVTGGSGGTSGVYAGVPLTGGSGTGATANITVSSGAVTAVAIVSPGQGYFVGDTVSASSSTIGNVTGFSVLVASVSINSSLAGGAVGMYVPGTLTPKQTWQNASQTTLNTNPINLDSNGCAIIYGTGTYRQIVYDSLGNEVWDQLTSVAPVNPFWSGTASGTTNNITLTDTGFSATDGQSIQFIAAYSNTGSTTINPSGYGAITVVENSSSGPVSLSGGEIVAGNAYTVVYSSSLSEFVLLNPTNSNTTSSFQVTPTFCPYSALNGTTPNDTCIQNAINYVCATANSSSTNVAGQLIFARALYYIKYGVTIPKSCSGLQLVGQGFGNPTSVNTHSSGTFIISDNNCTGPIINFYSDATQNYVYGGGISNIGFWNNELSGGSPYGANSCLNPLIQVNHAQVFSVHDIYAWQPYQFLKEVGGLFYDNENIYLDEALEDSPGEFEFTGWGANPDATGQATRQDQVLLKHAMMFANTTPQSGHKLPVGIWWHGFSVSLKTFDTEMEFASTGLQVDCTTTQIAAAQIGACPAYGVFNDFETEGANGGSGALINMTDAQNMQFNYLYAAAFASGFNSLGGSGYVVKVKNTSFTYTGVIAINGGQINGAGASGIDYEGYELTVSGGTHVWGNNATNVGGSEITLEAPVAGNTSGSNSITGNDFCAGPAASGDSQNAVISISAVASATAVSSGSGGSNGSAIYTVTGGTCSRSPTLNVTWASGALTVNSVADAGSCLTLPTNPATLSYLSGAASGWTGATANLFNGQDYDVVLGNNFRGCAAGVVGSLGSHGVNSPNAGP